MGKQCDLGPARRWRGTCSTRGSSVTQKKDSPDFWNLDRVKSSLTEPTYLLSFLPFSFSISSILHSFPTHDDIILPIYPIHLILLPIYYDDAYPHAAGRDVQSQPAAGRDVQSQPAAGRDVQSQPAARRDVQSQPAAGRLLQAGEQEGAHGGGGEERRMIAQGSEYSMAGLFLPYSCVASRQSSGHVGSQYIFVPCHEIYHFTSYHVSFSSLSCIPYFCGASG